MPCKKQAVDTSGLSRAQVKQLGRLDQRTQKLVGQGINGELRIEAVPGFIQTESEVPLNNKNNAWIILGRDRNASIASGYGGRGDTQAGSVDIVVGRMGAKPVTDTNIDPDFKVDSARIYISQKSDIYGYFKVNDGRKSFEIVGPESDQAPASGIGIKADQVAIIGRSGIKFVTTTDGVNSQGCPIKSIGNIDFLAGNNADKLEPLVKGKQLKYCLDRIMQQIAETTDTLNKFLLTQMALNASLATHTHQCVGPWGAPLALPSFEVMAAAAGAAMAQAQDVAPANVINIVNKAGLRFNCLNEMGKRYILSRNVNTT